VTIVVLLETRGQTNFCISVQDVKNVTTASIHHFMIIKPIRGSGNVRTEERVQLSETEDFVKIWERTCPICGRRLWKSNPAEEVKCLCGKFIWR
jgi:hypothetical protein